VTLERLRASLADRYRIERELGQGGMATVYLAYDVKHDRKVALKVLKPELSAILGADRFLHEIKTTANLQHPHILSLFDSGEAEGFVFYVMPYVEGESLRDRLLREKQLPVEDAVRIAREVADALDYAHRHGVVHRDIKPENILLHDGRAQVADFGIALAAARTDGGSRMTETGMSLGTPFYMSPEQAMGEREITAKSDVYALGCVMYEMLVGEPPFMGPTAQAIIARVMTEAPRSLQLQRRTIPTHVEAAVQRALEKLPADRFQSAAEFGTALGDPGYDRRITVTRAAQGPGGVAFMRPLLGPRAALAALAVLAALAAWGWFRPSKPVLPIRYRVALGNLPLTPRLVGRDLAIAPDGRTIVFSRDSSRHRQLWIKTADRADPEPLTGTADGEAPSFSPDGEWVAFAADGRLRKVPRLGGSAVTIADSMARPAPAIAWLDDGTVLFNGPTLDLRAVHQDGGPVRVVIPRDSLGLYVAGISGLPGGRTALVALCAIGCTQARLLAVNLESGVRRDLAEDVIKTWAFAGGRMAFVRTDGGVFLASVDEKALAFRAAPLPVLEGVQTSGISAAMALAADGTLLFVPGVAEGGGDGIPTEAVWVTRDGKATPVDSGWSFGPAGNGGLALSPDGRRLALAVRAAGADDIWIKELDRGPFTRLTFEGVNVRPAWTDGGRSLLYLSRPDTIGSEDLKRRRADGTGSAETLFDATRPIFEVRPLRDTTQLLVRLGGTPTRDVYLLRRSAGPGDSALIPLLADDKFEEVSIALSPDERWLAYASNESGRYEVYVRSFPDVNAGRWQVSRDGGNEPLWSHSGRELFFRSAAGQLVAVPVREGPGFTQGEHRPLFQANGFVSQPNHTEYDLAPDDRNFVFLRRAGAPDSTTAVTTAIMVQNWLGEVDARQAGPR